MDHDHQVQVSAGQAREVSASWWTRDITTKTREATAQYIISIQR